MALKNEDFKNIVESAIQECGTDNKYVGYEYAAKKIDNLMEQKKLTVGDFSVREMYQSLVDPNLVLHDAPAKVIAEAISASAFPNITTKIMTRAAIPSYEKEVGNIKGLVTEEDAYHAGTNSVPGFTAADGPKKRPEGTAYKESGLGEKYVDIDTADIGQIINLTRESIFNDQTGQLTSRAAEIGEYLGQSYERLVIQTLEMAARTDFEESTSRAFVIVGSAITSSNFYNSDHSAITGFDGQVNDTVDATDNSELTTDGIDNLRNLFSKMLDEKGNKISIKPKQLIVPDKLMRQAWQLVGSGGEFDTANRTDNYFKGLYDVYTSNYLSTDYYYYLGNANRQIKWLWVWRPETEVQGAGSDLAFERQIVLRMRTSMYGGCGHTDYRHIARGGAA